MATAQDEGSPGGHFVRGEPTSQPVHRQPNNRGRDQSLTEQQQPKSLAGIAETGEVQRRSHGECDVAQHETHKRAELLDSRGRQSGHGGVIRLESTQQDPSKDPARDLG